MKDLQSTLTICMAGCNKILLSLYLYYNTINSAPLYITGVMIMSDLSKDDNDMKTNHDFVKV